MVIQDINVKVKSLQKDGSMCKGLCLDDRRFFKTPYWKLEKKTEQQKLRYIETAVRLLDDNRKSGQQNLQNWRLGGAIGDSSSEDLSITDQASSIPPRVKTQNRYRQTTLGELFSAGTDSNSITSIDGANAGGSSSSPTLDMSQVGSGMTQCSSLQPPAGGGDWP